MSILIGANYHPHDWDKERWKIDVSLMKKAGFNAVRVGHLCWDSFEMEEGVYTFEWFDEVLDLFYENDLKVFLDISVHPAPVWVHRKCPGVNIVSRAGSEQASLHRYMEDMADPDYQFYAFRFARVMIERYKDHPAVYALSMCNEIGSGKMSFSEYSRKRFISFLEDKYKNVDALNKAWSTQRWCRKLNSFEDVVFPENDISVAMPEARLDMRRFFSKGLIDFLTKFSELMKECAPNLPYTTNLYPGAKEPGYDYMNSAQDFMDYPGLGYYPDFDIDGDMQRYFYTIIKEDLNELNKPLWFLEFQTGKEGIFAGPKGYTYMQLMHCLLYRGEVFLAWTFRTMYAGEEQFYYGLLDHDGEPGPNYYEFQEAAEDFKKLSEYGFPYMPSPEVGLAFNYDSWWFSEFQKRHIKRGYTYAIMDAHEAIDGAGYEYNLVSLKRLRNDYKLLVIPNHVVMDDECAESVRRFVEKGGSVIMTGYSAIVNENGSAYTSSHPGKLSDVFGIKTKGFFRTDMKWCFSENSEKYSDNGTEREALNLIFLEDRSKVKTLCDYVEILELKGARVIADFEAKELVAVTVHKYGSGFAYYIATECDVNVLKKVVEIAGSNIGIKKEIELPKGIKGREISKGQYFLVNTTDREIEVSIPGISSGKCVLGKRDYAGKLTLKPYRSELVVKGSERNEDQQII